MEIDSEDAHPVRGRPSLLGWALLFYAVVFAAAGLWAHWSGRPLLYLSAAAAERGIAPLRDGAAGLATAVLVVFVSQHFTRRTRVGERLAIALATALGPLSLGHCIALALASGVAEEALFRGALQPRVGLVAASLIFGLAHFAPRRELLPWTFFSIGAGFLLGGLFALTGNLVAPVVAHASINAVNLRFLTLHYAPRSGAD